MTMPFTYNELQNGNVLLKSWVYPKPNEMDIEIWIDGEYSQSITVDLSIRQSVA